MAVGRAHVAEWLRSLNLEHYIQAFLDNGYDDMDVCRQIGHLDLDAIGVHDQNHRQDILDQVQIILAKDSDKTGPGPVYFTLENPEYDDPALMDTSSGDDDDDCAPSLPPREYKISAVDPESSGPVEYADETDDHLFQLPTCIEDPGTGVVPMTLRESLHRDGVAPSNSYHGTPLHHLTADKSNLSHESAYLSGAGSLEALSKDTLGDLSEESRLDHKTSTLGRLFRQKRSSPKFSYKQHKGDLNASEITMSANQRIQLMLQVKQGQLSQEDVLQKVRLYEQQKRFGPVARDITPISPSQSYEAAMDQKHSHINIQRRPRNIPTLFRSKILPFFHKRHAKEKQVICDLDRKGSLPVQRTLQQDNPRRGSLPAPPQGTATETSSGDFDDWRASPECNETIAESDEAYQRDIYPGDDPELVAMFKDGRLLKQRPIRRCQEDTMDLNSDGMSQGESERTASSSLESVHSCSGGVPSLSSSSSQGSMTLDDLTASRGHPVCLARVLVDYVPSPYDKEALRLKKGDLIQVLKKNASGIWLGRLENKIGSFKFINVELLSDETPSPGIQEGSGMLHLTRQSPWSSGDGMSMVENLLTSLHLQDLVSVFLLNGYMTLDDLKDLTEQDLDELHVCRPQDRSKVMTAIQLINSGQVLSRESSGTKLSASQTNCHSVSNTDSAISSRTSLPGRYQESKIPSPRKSHIAGSPRIPPKHQVVSHHRKVDSGYEPHGAHSHDASLDSNECLNVSRTLGLQRLSTELRDYLPRSDCDNLTLEEYRSRTLSLEPRCMTTTREAVAVDNNLQLRPPGSPSRIPRGRTSSFDKHISKGTKLPCRKSHRSRQQDLVSAVDSAYSSAPNTPVLQRNSTKQRSPRHSQVPHSPQEIRRSQDSDLLTMYPHLSGVKTAHIRNLSQSISRSAPCSPAVVRVTPAARSSVHAHPRAGKPPRLQYKGAEAWRIEPQHFSQDDSMVPSAQSLSNRGTETITMATIVKSLKLSQYEPLLRVHGILTKQHFLDLKEKDFRNLGIQNKDHLHRLLSWSQLYDPGEMRIQPLDASARAHRVSTLRDKV